jgi:hypothetical protein
MNDAELRRKALDLIQIADVSSVLVAIRQVADAVNGLRPNQPPIDIDDIFLQTRKALIHKDLEDRENTNPLEAAQLQEVIDKYCTHFPFDY